MALLGILLLAGLAVAAAVVLRRGTTGYQPNILVITGLITIPAALVGILIMGFSVSAEETRGGAILLASSVAVAGGITTACVLKWRKLKRDQ